MPNNVRSFFGGAGSRSVRMLFYLLLAACFSAAEPSLLPAQAPRSPTPAPINGVLTVQAIAKGLEHPWGLEFLPELDGFILDLAADETFDLVRVRVGGCVFGEEQRSQGFPIRIGKGGGNGVLVTRLGGVGERLLPGLGGFVPQSLVECGGVFQACDECGVNALGHAVRGGQDQITGGRVQHPAGASVQ